MGVEQDDIVINEVCSRNFSVAKDMSGKYTDYIELYNRGNEEVFLDDYCLSDDRKNLLKYSLQGESIGPKQYLLVWLNGNDDLEKERTGFRISGEGESIFLSKKQEEQIVDSVSVPKLKYDSSFGRMEDGKPSWSQMTATAGSSNQKATLLPTVSLEEPDFSVESGFYESGFSLKMTCRFGETIYYTLDGSTPTTDSLVYKKPILIEDASNQENVYAARKDLSPTRDYTPDFKVDKATVVRAVSYNKRQRVFSDVKTAVYFVGFDNRSEYDSFPIISLVTDPSNLFDREKGIYTNGITLEKYKEDGGEVDGELLGGFEDAEGNYRMLYEATNAFRAGKEWERESVFSFFDEEHQYQFSKNVGIRIAGASTRATPQKSLNVYTRDIYDKEVGFPIEFFEGYPSTTIKLRNGGNHNAGMKIIDAFVESFVKDRAVSTQDSRPAIVFLNGEYWGIYNIRERYQEEYLQTHFGVSPDNVWMMDGTEPRVGGEEARSAYEYLYAMATECDLSYDDVYEMVSDLIDIQSLIDYTCINLFLDNRDVARDQNTSLWRSIEASGEDYQDGKWRWMLFDLDEAIEPYDDSMNPGEWMQEYNLMQDPVVQGFLANEGFRKQFCISFMDIANHNYAYEKVHKELTNWDQVYKEQIVKNHQRFFDEEYRESDFEKDILFMDDFFARRFPFVMEALKETFDLTGTLEPVEITNNLPQAGSVHVNTATIEAEKWQGEYFTDYPLMISVSENPGYQFVGWKGSITSEERFMEVPIEEGGIRLEAEFRKIDGE